MAGQESRAQSVSEEELKERASSIFWRFEHHIWRAIISGFVVSIPLLITYIVLRFFFINVDDLFRPIVRDTVLDFPGIGVVATFVLLYVIGSFMAGKRMRAAQDAFWSRVPVVNRIYIVAREAMDALSTPMEHDFSRVVFVEWPSPGIKAMGFVTGHLGHSAVDGKHQVAVYIPTVPNPTSGMLAFVSEDDVVESDISVQEAMKTVLSGGIVLPEPPEALGLLAGTKEGTRPEVPA